MNRLKKATKKYYDSPNYCKYCGAMIKITAKRPPSEAKRRIFCNHKCAASFNNVGVKKHGSESNICPQCGGKKCIKSKTCNSCRVSNTWQKNLEKPIKCFLTGGHLHPRFKHNRIRLLARKLMHYWNIPKKCYICGYDKHVHVCHKVPITNFCETEPMKNVNNRDNLIYLCPNCHWEFDNGTLTLR